MQAANASTCRLWRTPPGVSDPAVSQWIMDIWVAHGRPCFRGSERLSPEGQALLFFVSDWFRKRKGYQFVLPPGITDWLNTPELDLTEAIQQRPCLHGSVPTTAPKPVSRLMYSIAEQHNRLSDFRSAESYYEFLTWYAFSLMPDWNLPRSLLPASVIDLLNAPAGEEDFPLTVGMWLRLKAAYPAEARPASPGDIRMLARSFRALEDILSNGDVRLIPPAVSGFWSQRPLERRIITAFEYVLACTVNAPAVMEPIDELELRDWYHREVIAGSCRSARHLLSGPPSPRPSTQQEAAWSILDKAVLLYRDHDSVAGLSQAGERARDALIQSGISTFDVHFSLGRARLHEEADRNRALWVNARRRLHLMNLNPEYVPECYYCNSARFGPQDYIVGQFYWELSRISRVHELGITLVDEIWTASEYLTGIYSAETDRPVITMGQAVVVTEPLVPIDRSEFGINRSAYVFFSNFDSQSILERKNPLGVITAFQIAFPRGTENVALLIKTRNLERPTTERDREHWAQATALIAKDPRVRIITHTMSQDEMAALYRMCDCFVSLHRSEGFGFGPAEAMAHGKPVIVTNYSGVCDFCTQANSRLVGYQLIRVKPNEYPYQDDNRVYHWADPDLKEAAEHMRELAGDRAEAEQLGRVAKELIAREFSVAALHSRYITRLRQLGFA